MGVHLKGAAQCICIVYLSALHNQNKPHIIEGSATDYYRLKNLEILKDFYEILGF